MILIIDACNTVLGVDPIRASLRADVRTAVGNAPGPACRDFVEEVDYGSELSLRDPCSIFFASGPHAFVSSLRKFSFWPLRSLSFCLEWYLDFPPLRYL